MPQNPLAYGIGQALIPIVPIPVEENRDPINDDASKFVVGQVWKNKISLNLFMNSGTTFKAIGGSGSGLTTLTTSSGTATISGTNITLANGTNVTMTATGSTVVVNSVPGTTVLNTITTPSGTATVSASNITFAVGGGLTITGTGSTVTLTATGGTGDVVGPGSSVADNFASFADTSGVLLADSGFNSSSFQPINANLTSISTLGTAANKILYTTALHTWAETDLSSFVRGTLGSGTAQTFNNSISVLTTKGDILAYDGSTIETTRFPIGAGSNGNILTLDSTQNFGFKWAAPATAGDVVGPGSSTDNALPKFSGTTGKLIQNTGIIVDTFNGLTGVNSLVISGSNGNTLVVDNKTLNVDAIFHLVGIGTDVPNSKLHVVSETAATNTPVVVPTFEAQSTGTVAAGFGIGMPLLAENSSGTSVKIGSLESIYTTATSGAESAYMKFSSITAGSFAEDFRSSTLGLSTDAGSNFYKMDYAPKTVGALNIRFSLNGGVLTITQNSGSAFGSGDNQGFVTIANSSTNLTSWPISSSITSFATTNCSSMKFGVNVFGTDRNWANSMPFFVYAIAGTSNLGWAVSRSPCFEKTPSATSLGVTGAIINVDQNDMFLFDLGGAGSKTGFAQVPCICLGAFRMTYAAGGNWTISSWDNAVDGIGHFHDTSVFNFPPGVNNGGNNAGDFTWFLPGAAGSEGPAYSLGSSAYWYRINRTGQVSFEFAGNGQTQSGIGTAQAALTFPYDGTYGVRDYMFQLTYKDLTGSIDKLYQADFGSTTQTGINDIHPYFELTSGASLLNSKFTISPATGEVNLPIVIASYTAFIADPNATPY